MAAFATRRRAANSGVACLLASSGARRRARFVFTLMKPSAPRSARSLPNSPRPARPGAYGCGSARRGSNSRCRCIKAARSDGSRRATPLSTRCSPPGLRRRLRLWQNPPRDRPRCRRRAQETRATPPARRMAGADPGYHPGFIDWQTYEANQERIARNTRPGPHQAGGAVREGGALLQGLARCGHCGRRLHTHYRGRNASPGYHCAGKVLVENRGVYCLNIGGIQIDAAVTRTFVAALEPAGLAATLAAAERLEVEREAALKQWRLGVERANYEAQRAERRYRAVDPDNRLVARGLERDWEERLRALETARIELERREKEGPRVISQAERNRLLALGPDLAAVWNAPTTTPRDRKELLRTLIEDVTIKVDRDKAAAHLALRWKGGALNEIDLTLPRSRPATVHTGEDTIALLRRLAVHYPDGVIAGILNRQERATAYGHRFTAGRVGNLRRHWGIPCFEPTACAPEGELLTIKKAALVLGVAPSTIHRLLNDGIIAGEQLTPGAPWRIRLTKELKDRFNGDAGEDFLPMREAMRALGVSRQTVLQRVKRGELAAVHVMRGKQKGLRVKVIGQQTVLFDPIS